MADIPVAIKADPVKERLIALRRRAVLTPQETKEAIDGLIDYLELD